MCRIGIIDGGKIQVIDSPENMKNAMGNEVISITIENDENLESIQSEFEKLEHVYKINRDQNKFTMFASNGTEVILKIFQISNVLSVTITSISLTKLTLDMSLSRILAMKFVMMIQLTIENENMQK